MLNKWQNAFALLGMLARLSWLVLRHIPNPITAFWAMQQLVKTRRKYMGDFTTRKFAKVNGRYFFDLNTPGWPSEAFDQYHLSELDRIMRFREKPLYLKVLLLAITKKCAMQCEHCFEWEELNGKEKLSVENLKTIIRKFQANGVGQVQFSGGEPLLRMPAILELMASATPSTDFWVLTSGHLLTLENALTLHKAGITGVAISLDHFLPEEHDKFRGFDGAYTWALAAAHHVRQAGLVLSLSLCTTRTFTTEENLHTYLNLARKLGAAFVQVLEPREVGHYQGQDVDLTPAQQKLLTTLYEKVNFDAAYQGYPVFVYHEYHRRRAGCTGAADRYVYVDTEGELHACPFCRKASGSALGNDLEQNLLRLRNGGCPDDARLGKSACHHSA